MSELDEFIDKPPANFFTDKSKLTFVLFGTGFLMLIIVIGIYVKYQFDEQKTTLIETNNENYNITKDIIIDISGAVIQAGVYRMENGSRVNDVLIKAGGIHEGADKLWVQKQLNLASTLSDGQKIYIPFAGEIDYSENSVLGELETQSDKININTATETVLDSLPGIGPVSAKRIIDYRNENGEFSNIEDLKKVTGIGESLFDKIKDSIYVK